MNTSKKGRGHVKDRAGETSGRLTVLQRSPRTGAVYWICACSCGGQKEVRQDQIRDKTAQSCGCILKEKQENPASKTPEGKAKNKIRQERWQQTESGKESVKRKQEKYCKTDKAREKARRFSKTPKGIANNRRQANLRRLIVQQQTPAWADKKKIADFYLQCPEGMTVDHIIPLKGRIVCGLHIETNLQYLTKTENSRKNNKLDPDLKR